MKNLILTIAAILLTLSFISAQTIIPGGNVSGIWTSAGSPYLVQGAIMVPDGSTLTIEPGVTVNFQGPYKLYPQGCVIAIGTASDSITFTAADTTTGWLGIQFNYTPADNDTSRFYYCKLQYSKATGNGGGFFILGFSKVVISNSLISNCRTDSYPGGGGIQSSGSSPIITHNTITNNITSYGGGGICCENASPVITDNIISNNTASNGGGGIECFGIFNASNAMITNNIISGNTSSYGGGIASSNNSPAILNNIISNNTALKGGGVHCSNDGTPAIINNTISNNAAVDGGGGICCDYTYGNPAFANNTISNNNAARGGGLFCTLYSNITLLNSIVWGNTAITSGPQVYLDDENSDPAFYYCDVEGGTSEFGLNSGTFYTGVFLNNLDDFPMFVSPTAGSGADYNGLTGDWSLQEGSPCINAGTPDTSGMSLPVLDLGGNPRIKGGRIDVGAYEYQSPSSIPGFLDSQAMEIFPNPVSNNLTIEMNQPSEIEILTVDGHTIKTIYSSDKRATIDLGNLSNGVYLIKTISDKGIAIVKFVKK